MNIFFKYWIATPLYKVEWVCKWLCIESKDKEMVD